MKSTNSELPGIVTFGVKTVFGGVEGWRMENQKWKVFFPLPAQTSAMALNRVELADSRWPIRGSTPHQIEAVTGMCRVPEHRTL